jgi:type IV pilus assembly protein PilQ
MRADDPDKGVRVLLRLPRSLTITALSLTLALAPASRAQEKPSPATAVTVTAIGVQSGPRDTVVTISADAAPRYEYALVGEQSLLIDLADAVSALAPSDRRLPDPAVSRIRVASPDQQKRTLRVALDLAAGATFTVRAEAHAIIVRAALPEAKTAAAPAGDLTAAAAAPPAMDPGPPPAPTPAPEKAVAPPPAAAAAPQAAANRVLEVVPASLPNRFRVEVRTSGSPGYTVEDAGDPLQIALVLTEAQLAPEARKVLDLGQLGAAVTRIATFDDPAAPDTVRVRIGLRAASPFHVSRTTTGVVVDVMPPGALPGAPPAAPAGTPAAAADARPPEIAAAPERSFGGARISLDFKDADVNDILRLIASVSGLNFVAGPEVRGNVTVNLADVPWDLALDLVLRTNQPPLAQVRESANVIRITTPERLSEEERHRRTAEDDRQKAADQQRLREMSHEPLETRIYHLKYVKAEVVQELVDKSKMLTKDGSVYAEKPTDDKSTGYTLSVTDIRSKLDEIEHTVIHPMDIATPAVVVEARIVEVSSDYGQQLGVQWNANFIADAAHGNATPYAFPNSVAINGTQAASAGVPGTYMVNLPAAASTAGIGLTLGHVANTLSLDMKLSAMEKLGKTKILSNPKILVVQNKKAKIAVGKQLPVVNTNVQAATSTTANAAQTNVVSSAVEWKDVGLTLEVTPNIIVSDRSIFMEVHITKNSQGENVQTTTGLMFSIVNNSADTTVLMKDGETTVIGGLFTQESVRTDSSVPGLGKLPLIGWLFRSKDETERKNEIMIFLTPRIVD